jgi:hypothetical protein
MKTQLRMLLILFTTIAFSTNAQEDLPFMNIIHNADFGELLGLPGSCVLDHSTNEVTDAGGSLCPFADQRYGEAGEYIIVATSNTNVTINISIRTDEGDGLNFVPSGVYQVNGESDISITATQDQTIFSGNTGVITIVMGGTLTASNTLAYNASYSIELENGISFNEVP